MRTRVRYWLVIILLAGGLTVHGQCPSYKYQPEFMVSYGQYTASDYFGSWKKVAGGSGNAGVQTGSTGADFFTARYFLYSCLSVGATAGYMAERGNNTAHYGFERVTTGTYEHRALTVAVEVNYIYRILKYLDVYTYVGTGPAFKTTITTPVESPLSAAGTAKTERSDAFVFHYSPLGIRVGGRVGGFAELGFGYKGLVSCGLSVRPGRRWCSRK